MGVLPMALNTRKAPKSLEDISEWELDIEKMFMKLTYFLPMRDRMRFRTHSYEAFMAFRQAMSTFDEDAGLFGHWLYNYVSNEVDRHKRSIRVNRSCVGFDPEDHDYIYQCSDRYFDTDYMNKILSHISQNDRLILIIKSSGFTYQEIGDECGCSYETIRQRYKRSIKTIREKEGIVV